MIEIIKMDETSKTVCFDFLFCSENLLWSEFV